MLIKKLWDIRGELDCAITMHNQEQIASVRYKFYNFFEKYNPNVFARIYPAFESEEEIIYDAKANVKVILKNMDGIIDRHVNNKKVSTAFEGKPNNIGAIVWTSRAKLDYVVNQFVRNPDNMNKDKIKYMLKCIYEDIKTCERCCVDTAEKMSIKEILEEIRFKKNEIFGKSNKDQDFNV